MVIPARLFEQRSWLARVRSGPAPDAPIIGTAFAIDEHHLLTCAHVVTAAGTSGPGEFVQVDFPLLRHSGRARVLHDGWRPVPFAGEDQSTGDTAVLRLDQPPAGMQPIPLRRRDSCKGLHFSSYGFPAANPQSDAAHGRLGLRVGTEWIRLEADSAAIVEPGFSGAPVWADDLDGVVGMILTRKPDGAGVAYAVSLNHIANTSSIVAAALQGPADPLAWLDHAPRRLAADILPFRSLMEERTQNFVGREFLFAALDRRLSDPDFGAGYILCQGEPGIGKSAIMAQLARTRGYAHHFNIARDNVRSPALFLRNACAQLIARYGLPIEELPANTAESAETLRSILEQSAAYAMERGEERVVLLVDALDESEEPPPGVNRLLLPGRLPDHCYVLATIRRGRNPLLDTDQRAEPIELDESAAENERDVKQYAANFLERNRNTMDNRLAHWKASPREFVETVWRKSEGNFMYLRHVLPELLRADGIPDYLSEMDRLPSGLANYYSRHWELMRDRNPARFRRLQRPILCVLAKAREAVPAARVTEWINGSGAFEQVSIGEVEDVFEEWAEFLHEEPGDPPRLRLYHNSFLEFLERTVRLGRYERAIAAAMGRKVEW